MLGEDRLYDSKSSPLFRHDDAPSLIHLACVLTMRGFARSFISIAKPLALALFSASGSRFDGRVAFRSPREGLPLGLPGDLPQGFGAFAGVPFCTKSDETTRWTRTGVSRPAS
jgi:hypothetical protein